MEIPFFSFEIIPENANTQYLICVGKFDPKLTFVPNWLINFVTRKFASTLIKRMLSKGKNFKGSFWDQAI